MATTVALSVVALAVALVGNPFAGPFGGPNGGNSPSESFSGSAATFTSTQSDGGAAFVAPTSQRVCLNGAPCTVYAQYDGGSIGLVGAEVDVPDGFTDSQKVNSGTTITPNAVVSQAAAGQVGMACLNNCKWDFGDSTNDFCQSSGGEVQCSGAWQWGSIEVDTIGNATPGRNRIEMFYPQPFPLGSLTACDSDHKGVLQTLTSDNRTYQCNGTTNQTFGFRAFWSGSLDFGAIPAGECDDLTFAATGAVLDEAIACGGMGTLHAVDSELTGECAISATDTVQVRACCHRLAASCGNPAAITFSAAALR